VAGAMLEDVLPGLRCSVRELIRGDANYWTVLFVEFEQFER
jgi:hypothetical protein